MIFSHGVPKRSKSPRQARLCLPRTAIALAIVVATGTAVFRNAHAADAAGQNASQVPAATSVETGTPSAHDTGLTDRHLAQPAALDGQQVLDQLTGKTPLPGPLPDDVTVDAMTVSAMIGDGELKNAALDEALMQAGSRLKSIRAEVDANSSLNGALDGAPLGHVIGLFVQGDGSATLLLDDRTAG